MHKLQTPSNNKIFFGLVSISQRYCGRKNNTKFKSIKIKEQLNYILKKNPNDNIFILKISGIWEMEQTIGVTYKFLLDNTLTIS